MKGAGWWDDAKSSLSKVASKASNYVGNAADNIKAHASDAYNSSELDLAVRVKKARTLEINDTDAVLGQVTDANCSVLVTCTNAKKLRDAIRDELKKRKELTNLIRTKVGDIDNIIKGKIGDDDNNVMKKIEEISNEFDKNVVYELTKIDVSHISVDIECKFIIRDSLLNSKILEIPGTITKIRVLNNEFDGKYMMGNEEKKITKIKMEKLCIVQKKCDLDKPVDVVEPVVVLSTVAQVPTESVAPVAPVAPQSTVVEGDGQKGGRSRRYKSYNKYSRNATPDHDMDICE